MLAAQGISQPSVLSSSPGEKTGAKLPKATDLAKVKSTAKEFEATLLSMVLKEMRQTLDEENGGFFPGDTGDVQGGLFDQYMGRHLADSGGIGVAAYLVRQLQLHPSAKPVAAPDVAAPAPATRVVPSTPRH